MANLTLPVALDLHPASWLIDEPLQGIRHAIEAMREIVDPDREGVDPVTAQRFKYEPSVWTSYTGLVSAEVWLQRYVGEPRDSVTWQMDTQKELLNAFVNCSALIVLMDGIQATPVLAAALTRAVLEDKRVVLVSSSPPPDGLLRDYLQIVTGDLPDAVEAVRTICEREGYNYLPAVSTELRGLRTYRLESLVLEAYLSSPTAPVPYIRSRLRDMIADQTQGILTLLDPQAGYDTILGLNRPKNVLNKLTARVKLNERVAGALFCGVPGTGKTKICEAAAFESGLRLYKVDVGAAFKKHVGETEASILNALNTLRNLPPGIVLFNEIEGGLSGSSHNASSGDSGLSIKVGKYIVEYLENPLALGGFHLVLATSNNIRWLPAEFTRAGRWNVAFYFDYPSTDTLKAVLEYYRRKQGLPAAFGRGSKLDGMVPAEVEAACDNAKLLEITDFAEAVSYVPLLFKTRAAEINQDRQWAAQWAVPADDPLVEAVTVKAVGRSSRRV